MGFLGTEEFWRAWLMSSGFGGTMAVIAAALALLGVHRSIAHQQVLAHKEQWWERARWALDSMVSAESTVQRAGLGIAAALSNSEYADVHEVEIIDAAMRVVFEQFYDAAATSDMTGSKSMDEQSEEAPDDDRT